jgi:hypothetical protein
LPDKKETSEVRRKYEFIKANHGEHSVRMMCRLLDVAPKGRWRNLQQASGCQAHAGKQYAGCSWLSHASIYRWQAG